MNKLCPVLAIVCAALLLAAGCAAPAAPAGQPAAAVNEDESQTAKLSVYATFYPMYDFARKIGGERVNVANMTPAGMEPHDWEPAAVDLAALENADVLVFNGLGMEHWVNDALAALSNEKLVAVQASSGVAPLAGIPEAEGEDGEEEGDGHEDEGEFDPHVWLDPRNVKLEMANIRDAFISADPEGASYYEENYNKYAAELDALDQEFRDTLSPLPGKDIIVAHQAFAYLCAAYGLTQTPIEGLAADSEPDPARMAEIIEFAEEHEITVIFFEELVSPKVAETIAEAVGARTDTLNPLEGLSDEEAAAGDDYFSVMRQNLTALAAALQ
ncbi:MAG: metal ABC transporter substrate-binding protein [Gracilibacteraceae bacterium]|jgi:zinc transport system substrate-binding protein|nr:metal ABC transporter substrate-binding protein [Gracilibacteraceae bacterium]